MNYHTIAYLLYTYRCCPIIRYSCFLMSSIEKDLSNKGPLTPALKNHFNILKHIGNLIKSYLLYKLIFTFERFLNISQMLRLGERIRATRENLGIQVKDLAGLIDVTPSLISQIERAKAFPSILTLKKIADALHTTVGDLIGENATFVKNPYLNVENRKFVKKNKNGTRLYLLSHHDPVKQMDPFILSFNKHSDSTDIMTTANPRQEFCYVIKGHFKAILNTTEYELKEGDSLYFNSSQYYLFKNIGNESAELIWVVNQMKI